MEGLTSGLSEREAAGEAAREVVRRGGRLQMIGTNHGETLGFDQRFPLTGYSADTPKPGDIVTGTLHGAFTRVTISTPAVLACAAGRPPTSGG